MPGTSRAHAAQTFQPLCSVLFAAILLDESPSHWQLVGAACILAGLVVASIARGRDQAPEPEFVG